MGLGVSHEQALFRFNLAPLKARRDIAQLGLIHRAALRRGPVRLHKFFMRVRSISGHSKQNYDPCAGCRHLYIRRSMFGLVGV